MDLTNLVFLYNKTHILTWVQVLDLALKNYSIGKKICKPHYNLEDFNLPGGYVGGVGLTEVGKASASSTKSMLITLYKDERPDDLR